MKNNFTKNLKIIREQKNLSQQDIADKIGVDRSTIGYWENGKADPSMINVIKLSDALNVDLVTLIGGDLNSDNATQIDLNSEEEILKKALKNKGLLNENEEMTEEDFNRLIEFAKANKPFIMGDRDKNK